jgi:hypothetical protein
LLKQTLPKLSDKWFFEKTKRFHQEKCQDLSEKQKLVLTPIPIIGRENEEIRKVYIMSMKRLGYTYTVPAIAFSKVVKYKNANWFIYSAYYLYEWQNYLFREHKIIFDLSKFDPRTNAEEIVNKFVKFKVTKEQDAWFEPLKVRKNGLAYFYKVDEELPLREVK